MTGSRFKDQSRDVDTLLAALRLVTGERDVVTDHQKKKAVIMFQKLEELAQRRVSRLEESLTMKGNP